MTSSFDLAGRIEKEASGAGRVVTFDLVQDRLIEAWGFLRRMPDREAGWLREPRASAVYGRGQLSRQELWERYQVDSDDYDRDQRPKLPGLRAAEVDRMEEALAWMGFVDARDRKLVGVVLAQLQAQARPSWMGAARAIGWGGHPDTLAKRYSRAVTAICVGVERAATRRNSAPPPRQALQCARPSNIVFGLEG